MTQEQREQYLGNTLFHETLHQKYGNHEDIADKFGLKYNKDAKTAVARALSAEEAVNKFVNSGCTDTGQPQKQEKK